MNKNIYKVLCDNKVNIGLIEEMEKHYLPDFIEFIYEVLTVEDFHSVYDKYGDETIDMIRELLCYEEYVLLCSNVNFINKLYSLIKWLMSEKVNATSEGFDLKDLLRIILEDYQELIEK